MPETPDQIAEAVRAEMERRGLTYRELARLVGTSAHSWLHAWLAGRSVVNTDTASRVMDALGLGVMRRK